MASEGAEGCKPTVCANHVKTPTGPVAFLLLLLLLAIPEVIEATHAPLSTGPNGPWAVAFSEGVDNPENAFIR